MFIFAVLTEFAFKTLFHVAADKCCVQPASFHRQCYESGLLVPFRFQVFGKDIHPALYCLLYKNMFY